MAKPKIYTGFFLLKPECGKFVEAPSVCELPFVHEFAISAVKGKVYNGREFSGDSIGYVISVGVSDVPISNTFCPFIPMEKGFNRAISALGKPTRCFA
ncbi:hypothetical protein [Fluviispira sanaruensis]|uniref:Uncharacterized protein n=1 Tax=Fluviispira sanaruensis TaxID=2493639 RepID=A0A4P2VPY7_FLUSA|nr:hypothetical protein [Fluviispira sanaruensis]BBH53959.1 hypothetical protein JCM31447_24120 [Fluviispira sanaruensis]